MSFRVEPMLTRCATQSIVPSSDDEAVAEPEARPKSRKRAANASAKQRVESESEVCSVFLIVVFRSQSCYSHMSQASENANAVALESPAKRPKTVSPSPTADKQGSPSSSIDPGHGKPATSVNTQANDDVVCVSSLVSGKTLVSDLAYCLGERI